MRFLPIFFIPNWKKLPFSIFVFFPVKDMRFLPIFSVQNWKKTPFSIFVRTQLNKKNFHLPFMSGQKWEKPL